ncbi:MAG TPA: class E sortase, partial [Acidimicrobiales bacterium]|nr:class E sortase [Acidimicrobiales bacterium]
MGTALYEHSAQSRLKAAISKSLPHAHLTLPPPARNPGGSSSTALPTSHIAPPVADPGVGAPVGLMSIPTLGVSDAAIIEGTGESQLQQGPGHYPGTPLPGEAGNAAIAGHRTTYGAPFYSLDALHSGDAINIETPQGLFGYQVVLTKIVSPDDVSVLQPTPLPELTLTTCNPRYSATQRLVVRALLTTSVTTQSLAGHNPTGSGSSSSTTTTPTTVPTTL